MADKINYRNLLDEVLLKYGSFLDEIGLPFILIGGTLLGLIREKHLLGHDHDVDVAVWIEDLTPKIIEAIKGHQDFQHLTTSISGVGQLNLVHKTIHFDIFPFRQKENLIFLNQIHDECAVWPADVLEKSKPKKIRYLGRKWLIPSKPKKFLATCFGRNWRIPDKNYVWKNGPHYKRLGEFI